jgi:hypothetical protein
MRSPAAQRFRKGTAEQQRTRLRESGGLASGNWRSERVVMTPCGLPRLWPASQSPPLKLVLSVHCEVVDDVETPHVASCPHQVIPGGLQLGWQSGYEPRMLYYEVWESPGEKQESLLHKCRLLLPFGQKVCGVSLYGLADLFGPGTASDTIWRRKLIASTRSGWVPEAAMEAMNLTAGTVAS